MTMRASDAWVSFARAARAAGRETTEHGALEVGVVERGAFEDAVGELDRLGLRGHQQGLGERGALELALAEIDAGEVGEKQLGPPQVGPRDLPGPQPWCA